MKYKIASLLLSFSLLTSLLKAEPKHYASTINEVTVYLQGAMVKRTAQVSLQAGSNEIILDGLSNYLDINSVRLESSSSITIVSVNASTNYISSRDKTPNEIQLQTNLDTMNLKLTRMRNDITALNDEMEMLKANYKIASSTSAAYVDVLENSADFYQKRVREVLNDLTNLAIKEKELLAKTKAISDQINEIQNKNQHPAGEITVIASSPAYTEATFTFTYYVTNAAWTPSYNMRAENTTSNINLDYDAEIAQTTGEDWKNVKLILSTGNPSVNGVKPNFKVVRLDYYVPNQFRGNAYKTSKNIGAKDDVGSYNDPNDPYSTTDSVKYASDYTTVNKNILATNFEINLKYDILSDGISKYVRIQQYSLPAQFEYAALPKVSTDAFLQANITGWEEYNLLPGDVNIYLENAFVGKSYIDPTTTNDTLNVSFGRDTRINIKRIRVKNFTKNQFLGGNRTQSFGFATSIRNTKTTATTIKIEDQIPISNQKAIVVELLESSGAELDVITGKLTWMVTLQPNEEKALKFEYTVKYPKNQTVNF